MALIDRAKNIVLQPKATWPEVDAEPASTASIFTGYVMPLAAIPAVAGFIGLSLIGAGFFGVSFRVPIVTGLANMVVGYVLSLAVVFGLGLLVDALAPTFGGTKNPLSALKVVAYGSTAGFLGGIFSLLPALGVLGLLAALHSIYLLYTGLPVLMKCPPDKAVAYTAVVVVVGIVAALVLGAVSQALLPSRGMSLGGVGSGSGAGGAVSIQTPGGEVKIDTAKMEALGKQMEEATQRMEAAQKSGDQAAAGKAMGDMMGAAGGAGAAMGGGAAIAAQALKALLPETLGELKRNSIEAEGGSAMGFATSSAKARYAAGDKRVDISLTDVGGLGGMAALAGWANMTVDRETDGKIEKVYKEGGRTVREEFQKDGSRGELTVVLANGVIVEARGEQTDVATLKQQLAAIDLNKVEALKRPAKP